PPGYVGYEEGGQLTERVKRQPYSIVLLDEIEKAHPDVYNILLQVMDHGSLTDANGKKVDFRNVVLIMTTNAGASDAQRNSIGFGRGKQDDEVDEALKRLFTPEFRNRLDAVVQFKSLTQDIIRQVVLKFVMQLEAQLADRHVTIETTDEATDWLAKNGFDELYGARPLARVIQEHIKKPLADEILFGRLIKGGHVKVVLRDGKLAFDIEGEERERGAPTIENPAEDAAAPELAG
ncbi:MAG TPA: AAA family ATPase, partial [Phenylobacterium sp.]|nr:AAA family ATPase [Phenylobacterium sp.]